jgi:hypothetical protein
LPEPVLSDEPPAAARELVSAANMRGTVS